jgi:hypothetical protein
MSRTSKRRRKNKSKRKPNNASSSQTRKPQKLSIVKINPMEIAIIWFLAIGGIVVGIAACIYYGGSKPTAIWVGFAGCILVLLAAACQWQVVIQRSDSASMQAQQSRPYIQVEPGEIKDFSAGFRTEVSIKIKNVGAAAAYDVTSDVSVGILPFPLPENYPFPDVAQQHDGMSTLMQGAEGVGKGQFDVPLTPELIQSVIDGTKLRLYLGGTISYRFGNQRCKKRFLMSVGGPDFVASGMRYVKSGSSNLVWGYNKQYNDVSPECE